MTEKLCSGQFPESSAEAESGIFVRSVRLPLPSADRKDSRSDG